MADSTTAILSLTKPDTAPGGSTNTWGTKWNADFDLIDALFEDSGGDPVLKQSKGGTGAKTAAQARDNLGSSAVGDALFIADDATEACAEFEAASPARIAVVEQSTSSGEIDLEVGSWVICLTTGEPDINSAVVPKVSGSNSVYRTSSGTTLNGTWRARGVFQDGSGTLRKTLLQRVA
jgi:hypothetical protein